MKILLVSSIYPIGSEKEFAKNAKQGGLAIPSNVFQWAFIEGFYENDVDISVISIPSLPSFPNGYKRLITKELPVIYKNKQIGKALSYCTLMGLKEPLMVFKLKKKIKKWIDDVPSSDTGIIIIYGIYGPFLRAAVQASDKCGNIFVCPIATDLFISSLDHIIKLPLLKKIQGFFEYQAIKDSLKKVDFFILLAEGMVEFIPRALNNHIIIEGIANSNVPSPKKKVPSVEKIILYSGSLAQHTSVKELVDAFMKTTNPNYRLQICGVGLYSSYIQEKSIKDKRIQYFGPVDRNSVAELQRKATVLINPRLPSVPDTPYSFPSKTIEYMLSGTPMIGYRLAGIPEDYYDFFYTPKDESIESLTKLLCEVLEMPQEELDKRAYSSWAFISSQKNAKIQVKKIIEFFENKI